MSNIASTYQALAYHRANDLPDVVLDALRQDEAASNVVLPFALKARDSTPTDNGTNVWVVVYDDPSLQSIAFVLSCTRGPVANYPVFIVSCKQVDERDEGLDAAMQVLVRCLLANVSPERVFAVFSLAKVANMFAKVFEAHTADGISAKEGTYYDATLMYCTRETFKDSLDLMLDNQSGNVVIELCQADMTHLSGVKDLCKEFSEMSPPYILDDAGAQLEAEAMIKGQQAWIHLIQEGGAAPEIACLVAATRQSGDVITITKVITAARWLRRGCARRLMHRVCQDILRQKKRVALYVGNGQDTKAARKLYLGIGFQDVGNPVGQPAQGVENWVEIGFEGTELGYW